MSIDAGILMQVKSAPSAMQRAQTAAVSEQAGVVFYRFQGRPIPTTRPWCRAREGHVFHIEEIREWGRQAAAGDGWDGMVEGTNEQTIMTYLGGWYGDRSACRHVLIPVLPSRVPEEDMARMRAKGLVPGGGAPSVAPSAQRTDAEELRSMRETWRRAMEDEFVVERQHEELVTDFNERVDSNLSQEERDTLKSYTQDRYEDINSRLRSGEFGKDTGVMGEWADAEIKIIQAALKSSPLVKDQVVYRGMGSGKTAKLFAKIVDKTTPGTEISFNGFTSTSIKPILTHISKSEVVLRILVPAGSKAMYIYRLSAFRHEREILLDHGMKFKIIGHEMFDGRKYVDLVAIP